MMRLKNESPPAVSFSVIAGRFLQFFCEIKTKHKRIKKVAEWFLLFHQGGNHVNILCFFLFLQLNTS